MTRAAGAICHRGPDDEGIFLAPNGRTGLAHRRLSIIDLSSAGHQPMSYADSGLTIAFNGEIYNFREIRAELVAKGYGFASHSDTEVLLAAYAAWGPEMLPRLDGIFVFAIYDQREDLLFLASDHLGIKPLYYCSGGDDFAFASEVKGLAQLHSFDRSLDLAAVARHVTFLWSPGEQTAFRAVKRFPPATGMIVRNGREVKRWTYWNLPEYAPRRDWSAAECKAAVRDTLAASVERQMVSDAPLGAFLSGGLDSSAVVAAAARHNSGIQCFTIRSEGGTDEGIADDLPYAREVASHLQVKLHEVAISSQQLCDNVEDMVWMLDEPIGDPACLNVHFITRFARSQGIKVLLSGTGGDDIFSGYRRHQLLALDSLWKLVPGGLRRWMAARTASGEAASGSRRRLARLMRAAAADPRDRLLDLFAWRDPDATLALFSPAVKDALRSDPLFRPLEEVRDQYAGSPLLEQCLRLEQRFFLGAHNLIYTDKMSMANGVEVRVPLLSPDMVQLAATVPSEWKLRRFNAKWILKESQRGILPDSIIDRPKSGFGAPLRRWLRHEMRPLLLDVLSPTAVARRGLFDPAAVTDLIQTNERGETDAAYTLFSMMCIELWCRRFVDSGEVDRVAA